MTRSRYLFIIIITLIAAVLPAAAQSGQTPAEAVAAVESYNNWKSVEINGKIRLDKFFINPSIRIYMERDTKIMISARVPIQGEVARLELDTAGILAVNRLKKIYCREEAGDILKSVPARIGDLQSLIMGRLWLLGSGQLTQSTISHMSYTPESDCIVCVPNEQPFDGNVQYGFTLGYDSLLQAFYATTDWQDVAVLIEYFFKSNGRYDVTLQYTAGASAGASLSLSLDAPKWNPSPMDPWIDNPRYRRVGIKEILKF